MPATTKSLGGTFGPVHAPNGGLIDPTKFEQKGTGTERRLVDEDELPAEYKEAIKADDFIIYGKASVEQVDEDGQIIDIDALENSLDQLFKANNISRRHKDVRVGEVLAKYTLEEDTKFAVGDEMKEFEEGETLTTHAEGDELWIVANIWNDSEIAKDTRLRTMAGDLNGFSVTIYAKETENRSEGEYVTDLDWHAVTIGSDEKIKNKESRFGLAEFKARFGGLFGDTDEAVSPAHGQAEVSRDPVATTMWNGLLSKSADKAGFNGELMSAAAEAAQKAEDEDVDLKEAAEEVAEGVDELEAKSVIEAVSVLAGEDQKAGGDVQEVLQAVEEGELSAEEAAEVIADASGDGGDDDGGEEDEGEMKEEDEDDDEEEEDEKSEEDDTGEEASFEEKLEEHGVVTEDQLSEKLDEATSQVESSVEETVKGLFDESVPSAEDIAEKMETGGTSDPSGGSAQSGADYTDQIQSAFGGEE